MHFYRLAILLIFGYVLSLGCNSESSTSYNGTWIWSDENQVNQFELTLETTTDETLLGTYCAVFNSGTRIDCPIDEGETNVSGEKNGEQYMLTYSSAYTDLTGRASIQYHSESNVLEWNDLSPSNGAMVPKQAIMMRVQE